MAKTDVDWHSGATARELIKGWTSPTITTEMKATLLFERELPLIARRINYFDSIFASQSSLLSVAAESEISQTTTSTLSSSTTKVTISTTIEKFVNALTCLQAYTMTFLQSLTPIHVITTGGLVLDLIISVGLLQPSWYVRINCTVPIVLFHLLNHYLFVIETFPWVMISSCAVFHRVWWMEECVMRVVMCVWLMVVCGRVSEAKSVVFYGLGWNGENVYIWIEMFQPLVLFLQHILP
jgi:hypothetical protein